MPAVPWLRVVGASLPPLLVSLWLSVPFLQPALQVTQGSMGRATVCLVRCAEVIKVGDVLIACKADLLGVPYACRERWLQAGEVTATYARLPSLASIVGMPATVGTLVQLQRDGQVVFPRSVSSQVWAAVYGGWVFHAVYWPLAGLIIWRWPRVGRKASQESRA